MTAKEAWKSIMAGKKVRCVDWVKGAYIYYDKISFTIKDENSKRQSGMILDKYFSDKQWEIYEEDERRNSMDFEEVRKTLFEGKKVRCVGWPQEAYIYFDEKNMVVRDNNNDIQTYGIYKFLKDREWELYEEAKKVIKVFISQPMHEKSECEIKKERNKIKELIEKKYGEDYQIEYLNEDSWERPRDWTRIQNLGFSIMNMHDADIVVFAPLWDSVNGCLVEHSVARLYEKNMLYCSIDFDSLDE